MVRPSLTTLALLVVLGLLGTAAFAAAGRAREERSGEPAVRAPQTAAPPTAQTLQPPAELEQPQPAPPPRTRVLRVRGGSEVALRSRPGGPVAARVGGTTEFGSPTTLPVEAGRGGWAGVTSTALPNGKLGWVRRDDPALESARRTALVIRVDLSDRRMRLMRGDRVLHRATVGIGRPGSSTPTGRFAITDKLPGSDYGAYYGCCILALSGHQPNLPPGWPGGDRLAIHGTSNPAGIGGRPSAGCLHAGVSALQVLMRRVPLGTPVAIRR
jgi:L,D-transpeptidase catalytic domain